MILSEPNHKIAVIGDVMMDKYQTCTFLGTSPEEELAPKLRPLKDEESFPGGAANVCQCIKAWGDAASATLMGVVGQDADGETLRKMYPFLLEDSSRPTTTKLRYVTQRGRQVCRIDTESVAPIPIGAESAILRYLKQINPDVIVLSDYAKGVFHSSIFCAEIRQAFPDVPILVDPKGDCFGKYGKVTAITPNADEFNRVKRYDDLGRVHLPWCKAEVIIETRGEDGSRLWVPQRSLTANYMEPVGTVGAEKRAVGDPSGCGDAFIATLAVCLALNYPLKLAMRYATAAGAIAFDHRGVYAPTRDEIEVEVKRDAYKYFEDSNNGQVHFYSGNGAGSAKR